MSDPSQVNRIQQTSNIQANRIQQNLRTQGLNIQIEQTEDVEVLQNFQDNVDFTTFSLLRNADTLERRVRKHEEKQTSSTQEEDVEVAQIDATTHTAEEFEHRNPEMQQRALVGLKRTIEIDDTPEQILEKVLKSYPDHYLADEALDFLCQTSSSHTKVGINLRAARILLNERFGREVKAGRNINEEAKEFSKLGLGTAKGLRDLYRDVTGNPREPVQLFEELNDIFSFDKMKLALQFFLHSLGRDLKSKGPSISSSELMRLFSEVRTCQAILGIYRFFFQRMLLIEGQFTKEGLIFPKFLTFELLAKIFVKMITEKYPSPDKVLRLASLLNISEELLAQIIIFTQFRDALRGVSPRLFKSEKHRQEHLTVLIETISELDDLLEEEEEEEEEEKDEGDEKKDNKDKEL